MSKDNSFTKPPRKPRGRGPAGHMLPGEKAKNFKGTMKTLWTYIKPYWFRLALVALFSVAGTVFTVISPKILGRATDKIVEGLMYPAGIDFGALLTILIMLIVIYGVSSLCNFGQGFIMAGVSQRITYKLRDEISVKMDRLPLKYFDTRTHGEILSRVTNDVETINQSLNQSINQIITSVTSVIGILIMMITISVWMTLAAVVIIPLSAIIMKLIINKTQKHFKNQQKYLGEVNGHVEEMYTGHIIVKAFNKEEDATDTFDNINDKLYESAWKSQFLSGLMMPITGFAGNLTYVFVCIIGGVFAINGRISIGDIQAFIQYVRNFNQPVGQLANVANMLQSVAAAAERVFEFVDEEEETESAAGENDISGLRGQVCFEHVEFGYGEEKLIKDFSVKVEPGQRVAIVGPTGAGKTTIVKLLMRFYEINGGRILIDGVPISEIDKHILRKMFGMVLQDTWLFNGTVRDNIRYGKMDATDDQIISAAKAAHVDHFIRTQNNGYDTEINEEATNISQGQKQLLTIARAILADAPILILDEATSSVDTRTEVLIQKAMANLMADRTSFIIAHRLSTIKDADLILVINDGDIIEQGTHEQLLKKKGAYADLYNSQFT